MKESYNLKNNKSNPLIQFKESDHTYWHGEDKLISVTQLIGLYHKPFYSEEVAERLSKKRGVSAQSILDDWKKRSEFGTRMHEVIEQSVKLPHLPNMINCKVQDKVLKLFWNFLNSLTLETSWKCYPEMLLYNIELGIAGTVDLPIINHELKQIMIFDHKFMLKYPLHCFKGEMMYMPLNHLQYTKFNKYAIQLSLYGYLLQKMFPEYTIHELGNLVFKVTEQFEVEDMQCYYVPYMKNEIEKLMFNYKSKRFEKLRRKIE